MRILLDENLDWRLSREMPGHQVDAVVKIGWSGISNGKLLARAATIYEVLVTMDRGIPHQQNVSEFEIALVGLQARSNRLADTKPLIPALLRLLETPISPGCFYSIAQEDFS